jgi:hypothetical protein
MLYESLDDVAFEKSRLELFLIGKMHDRKKNVFEKYLIIAFLVGFEENSDKVFVLDC